MPKVQCLTAADAEAMLLKAGFLSQRDAAPEDRQTSARSNRRRLDPGDSTRLTS
jgi:hypothetical protein